MPRTGDKYCENCFGKRKGIAQSSFTEDFENKDWGLYLIPVVGLITLVGKKLKYPNGYRYHLYVNGYHERWSKNFRDSYEKQKCYSCGYYDTVYYELESWDRE